MKPLPSSPTARRALAFDALLENAAKRSALFDLACDAAIAGDNAAFREAEKAFWEIGVQLKGHKL